MLGRERDKLFLSVRNAAEKTLFALALSDGTAEELAQVKEANDDFLFVSGLGCCRVSRTAGRVELRALGEERAFILPERIGTPSA